MRKSTIYLYVLGLAVVIVAALASTGLVVSAQNANSSTTAGTETAKPKRTHKPKSTARRGRCDPNQHEQTDLSGTYTGKAKHGPDKVLEDATLTITGNNFTMTSGSETHQGRITAVTTCGYTAVTMMMGDLTPPAPGPNPPAPLPAVSLRARRVGDKLWLTSVPGEPMQVSFTPTAGGSGKAKARRKHTAKKTETAAPAKTTP